jgi:hypothetical protein
VLRPLLAGLCCTACDVQGYGYIHHEHSSGDLQTLLRPDSPPGRGSGVGALGIGTQRKHRCTGNGADQVQQRGPHRRPNPLSYVRLRRAGIAADRFWRLTPNTLRRKYQRRSVEAVCRLRQSRRTIVRSGSDRSCGQRYQQSEGQGFHEGRGVETTPHTGLSSSTRRSANGEVCSTFSGSGFGRVSPGPSRSKGKGDNHDRKPAGVERHTQDPQQLRPSRIPGS